MGNNENQSENSSQWINFICPSCAVAYGVNTLIKTIKKRREQKRKYQMTKTKNC
jgi:hypothetical protein